MADINAYLREAINGPAPQHKVAGRNQFEITEGSDGATHTKIVGADGEPLDKIPVEVVNAGEPTVFPEDYPDSAVRAELAEIKATQAEILERLDGTFDTRVTGSNVEEVFESTTITEFLEGDTFVILDDITVENYSYLFIALRTTDHISNLNLQVISGLGNRSLPIDEVTFDREFRFSHTTQVVDNKLSVWVINSDSDTTLRYIKVVGIK